MSRALWFLLPGALFGAGLAIAGMTNPQKVVGFLDLFGRWDPSLALVMGAALLVYGIGAPLVERRPAPVFGGSFPSRSSAPIDGRLLAGAALFGIGWGLSGFCPGPAIANLATLRLDVVGFVVAMLLGMRTAQRVFGSDGAT